MSLRDRPQLLLRPIGLRTNRAAANALDASQLIQVRSKPNGSYIDVWRCEEKDLAVFHNSIEDGGLEYEVWIRDDTNSLARKIYPKTSRKELLIRQLRAAINRIKTADGQSIFPERKRKRAA